MRPQVGAAAFRGCPNSGRAAEEPTLISALSDQHSAWLTMAGINSFNFEQLQ